VGVHFNRAKALLKWGIYKTDLLSSLSFIIIIIKGLMQRVSSKFSWNDITIGPSEYSQYQILYEFLNTKHRRFYIASHKEFGDNVVIKQFPQEKLLDMVSAIRYLYIFNGMPHSINVYDMWGNNIAMERLDGIMESLVDTFVTDERFDISTDEIETRDAIAYDCFLQLLRAIRDFHLNKIALFNISPKTIGWVVNKNGDRVYKFFDYTTAKSFSLVKHNPVEDVIALGRIFEKCKNPIIQSIANKCVSGRFTSPQLYQKALLMAIELTKNSCMAF